MYHLLHGCGGGKARWSTRVLVATPDCCAVAAAGAPGDAAVGLAAVRDRADSCCWHLLPGMGPC